MKYKETTKDIRQIGKELMVGCVLEGSVRKSQNKARITVQLVDVAKQENLWSKDFDRELSDIFSIQSEIAENIARELKVRLVQSEMQPQNSSTTDNMQAYQEYLVGKHFLNQRTPESVQAGMAHFEKSIELDPGFALPYPAVAYCYALTSAAGFGSVDRNVAEQKAKAAVRKALELDSNLAEAHAAYGYIIFRMDWDWEAAEREFKKAIELKPGYATAHEWYALYLAVRVRLDEALREIKFAYDLDPLSPNVSTGVARIYHFRNEYDKALQQIDKTIKMDPGYAEAYFTKGMTLYKMKDYRKAEILMKKALELSGRRPVMLGMLGSAYSRMGNDAEVKKIVQELNSPPFNNDKLYALATIKLNTNEVEQGFDIMEQLIKQKYGIMIYMKVEKDYFGLNNHPRYRRMIQQIGL